MSNRSGQVAMGHNTYVYETEIIINKKTNNYESF